MAETPWEVAYFTSHALRPLGHGAGARRRSPAAKDEKTDKRELAGLLSSQPRVCPFHHDGGRGSIRALA